MAMRSVEVEPDARLTELVGRLSDDSKRLVSDEVRLAKIEIRQNIKTGARGALWMGLAFGVGVIALVAFTIFLSTVLWRAFGLLWLGVLVTAVIHLVGGFLLLRTGMARMSKETPPLEESRAELRETANWVGTLRN